MKKAIVMAGVLFALTMTAGCGSQNQDHAATAESDVTENEEEALQDNENTEKSSKVLVAYYSATGNTKAAAETIADAADGELFELQPAEAYTTEDLDYNDPESRVCKEHADPDQIQNWVGSPNKKGSTSILAESFAKGAVEAGHKVERFDLAKMNIHPCIGCVACGYEGPCVQKDDNQQIREAILGADMVVFATPLYYYGMSAQLKIVVDRFCAYNSSLHGKHMKSALLTVAWNADNWTFEALEAHYKTLVRYCGFKDQGMVLGYGCGSPDMTKRSPYVEEAYQMGKNL